MGHVAACDWLFRRARECEGGSVLQAQKQAVTAKAAAKVAVAHEAKGDAQAVHERWLAGQAILVTLEEHATVCIARARSQEVRNKDAEAAVFHDFADFLSWLSPFLDLIR